MPYFVPSTDVAGTLTASANLLIEQSKPLRIVLTKPRECGSRVFSAAVIG
jgi:hypothetical protein